MMHTPESADRSWRATLSSVSPVKRSLEKASGRVLRETVTLPRDAPPFDRVMMDGYAFSSEDWRLGTRRFRVVRKQAAGERPGATLSPGECVEIMTGAELPDGANCVVPYEDVERQGDEVIPDLQTGPVPGDCIHRRGADALAGKTVLAPGVLLGPREIGVAASCGKATLSVSPRLKVTVAATGDELIEPGESIAAHQIYASNGYALEAALQRWGGATVQRRLYPDDAAALRTALERDLDESDVVVLSGGVSKGERDFVARELAALGVREIFHGVAQKPGKPLWFGVTPGGKPVFGLPGNPLSTLVCAHRYLIPALEVLRGRLALPREDLCLAEDISFEKPLVWFLPVKRIAGKDGSIFAAPRPPVNSGDYLSVIDSDGFLELPADRNQFASGSPYPFWSWW